MRTEIEAHGPAALGQAVEVAMAAVTQRFGPGPIEGRIQEHIVTAAA